MKKKTIKFRLKRLFWIVFQILLLPPELIIWVLFKKKAISNILSTRPIFIIGAPRSGTTLLFQIMLHYFQFSYFNNVTANFPKTPWSAALLFKSMYKSIPPLQFESNFGKTKGKYGAHEAAEFWYRWFPRGGNIYTGKNDLTMQKLEQFAKTVSGLQLLNNDPIIFKNTFNSMRILSIAQALPGAIFLVCHRDPVDNAQSILTARIKNNISKNEWWSVAPREIDTIKQQTYTSQVVDQVFFIEKQIANDETECDNTFIHVNYKDFCNNPIKVLDYIGNCLKDEGVTINYRHKELPTSFKYSTGCKIDKNDYELIKIRVEQLWKTV